MTSNLSAFVLSLTAGAIVILAIGIAVTWVSTNDPITRKSNTATLDPIIKNIKR